MNLCFINNRVLIMKKEKKSTKTEFVIKTKPKRIQTAAGRQRAKFVDAKMTKSKAA